MQQCQKAGLTSLDHDVCGPTTSIETGFLLMSRTSGSTQPPSVLQHSAGPAIKIVHICVYLCIFVYVRGSEAVLPTALGIFGLLAKMVYPATQVNPSALGHSTTSVIYHVLLLYYQNSKNRTLSFSKTPGPRTNIKPRVTVRPPSPPAEDNLRSGFCDLMRRGRLCTWALIHATDRPIWAARANLLHSRSKLMGKGLAVQKKKNHTDFNNYWYMHR